MKSENNRKRIETTLQMGVSVNRTYFLGEYCLESEKRSLSLAGEQLRLTAKPFHVLIYLIENRDRLVPRAELLDRFWDGSEVYGDSVSKSIGAIRKALNDSAESPRFIQTRYSEGYRYIGPLEERVVPSPDLQATVSWGIETPVPVPEPVIAEPGADPEIPERLRESRGRSALLTQISALRSRNRIVIPALIFVVVALASTAAISYKKRSNAASQPVFPIRSI
ncbi:MAG TPA: winged helix-turn-helix domain-containing protein, partial [Blastocatellia bacterium]|nr:winged helix-turn-helix domain-containing protein [Blastocatellia bacterium]